MIRITKLVRLTELHNLLSVFTPGSNIKLHSHKVDLILLVVYKTHQSFRTSPTCLVGELQRELALEDVLPLNVYAFDIGWWDTTAAISSARLRLYILFCLNHLDRIHLDVSNLLSHLLIMPSLQVLESLERLQLFTEQVMVAVAFLLKLIEIIVNGIHVR